MANEGMQRQWNNPQFLQVWKGIEPGMAKLTTPLFDTLDPQPGERLLDVGCGGGLTTIEGALAVGTAGSVTGADISEELLELARSRAAEASVKNAAFVKADVQFDAMPGGPFDAAYSRLGVMFFSDFVAAFSNLRSHVKPGGRLVFICFQDHQANQWYGGEIIARHAPPRPPSRFPMPSPFALGEESATREFLSEAGFTGIEFKPFSAVEIGPIPDTPASVSMLAGLGAPPETLAIATKELKANEQRFVKNGEFVKDQNFWIVSARNP
jgi:ubiquinone/menaquinone biosynthesis C-methylase UbiE